MSRLPPVSRGGIVRSPPRAGGGWARSGASSATGPPTVDVEHPLEGGVVVRGAGVVLHDLASTGELPDDRLCRQVDGALLAKRRHAGRERLVDDRKRVVAGGRRGAG